MEDTVHSIASVLPSITEPMFCRLKEFGASENRKSRNYQMNICIISENNTGDSRRMKSLLDNEFYAFLFHKRIFSLGTHELLITDHEI